jgi:ATP-dependent helicase HrpB
LGDITLPPRMPDLPDLPIVRSLPRLLAAMQVPGCTVLEAPPGAGKSTVVPLALLDADWRADDRIIVLEPRRIAARAVARRMAETLQETCGQTVGYRTRFQSRVGAATRIEVVTDGLFTRMLQRDPAIEGVACVIFDEFHERRLQTDLGLALCLDARNHLRSELRILVMSATLDSGPLASVLGDAPVLRVAGRSFAVDTRFSAERPGARAVPVDLERRIAALAVRAIGEHEGDALLFLPGAAEIRRTAAILAAALRPNEAYVMPLYGDLPAPEQDAVMRPAPSGQRKIILATNIAETSLTIDGVRIVIDAGLERRQRFDPNSGMSKLETRRISRASAAQRRGRAGRTAPGVCYRMWSESTHESLSRHSPAEIIEADLAPLALDLACWGVTDPSTLAWLDQPPTGPLAQAVDQLLELEAIGGDQRVTPLGRRMAELGLHPRLARMVLRGQELGMQRLACEIAALLSERDPLKSRGPERDPDLRLRIEMVRGGPVPNGFEIDSTALRRIRQVADQLERRIARTSPSTHEAISNRPENAEAGLLLALAYPDRIGKSRSSRPGQYLLSGGRGASFARATALANHEYIVVASLDAGDREALIHLALPVDFALLEHYFRSSIRDVSEIYWDAREQCVIARESRCLGKLVLYEARLDDVDDEAVLTAMLQGIRAMGLGCLPWTRELEERRARLAFARAVDAEGSDAWPDVGDEALLDTLESWLAPWLGRVRRREQLARVDLRAAFDTLADWKTWRRLDEFAPAQIEVPSGSRIRVDYGSNQPRLSVRLQEVFGLMASPRIADDRVPVAMELLSPARRPVQLTSDLSSFWSGGYQEVRKELKGRYPKHYWPEDPVKAIATHRVRPRGS